ncbi:MAG: T9SS type A sorting domain-containing protein, partial [Sphingobacteriales bacterium]
PGINVAHSNKKIGSSQVAKSVIEIPQVHERILFLLRQNPDGGLFATNGFAPPDLSARYTFLKPNPPFLTGNSDRGPNDYPSVRIDPALRGTAHTAGQTLTVNVAKLNTDTLLIHYTGTNVDEYSDLIFGANSTFSFPIPASANGILNIEVFGFNNQKIGYDSSHVLLTLPASITLDSIKIEKVGEPLKIFIGDSARLAVKGYYSDNVVRTITEFAGVSRTLAIGNVVANRPDNLKGTVRGFDQLYVTYLGKIDSLYLEVVARSPLDTVSSVVLPVKFVNISAEYTGKKVIVKWNTSMEQNNARFEIEHSTDGNSFVYAGTQAATNLSNGSTYHFDHLQYVAGRNYYRIKQIDLDGKFSYSNIALAIVTAKNNITIYPNPVLQTLKVEFKDAQASKAVALRIINTAGQVVHQQQVAAPTSVLSVPVDNLAPGMYTIEIIGKNNTRLLTEKFVKNRL